MYSDNDFKKAISIINNLIDGIKFLPISWEDNLAIQVSDDVKEFMKKHDPENWS